MNRYFTPPTICKISGIVIRPLKEGDGVLLRDSLLLSENHLQGYLLWLYKMDSPEQSEQIVRFCQSDYLLRKNFIFGIFDAQEEKLFGTCGYWLSEGPFFYQTAEIGGWIAKEKLGKGLAMKVGIAFIKWGLTEWKWERLFARVNVDNQHGLDLASRLGMHREGVLRNCWDRIQKRRTDIVQFSILREDITNNPIYV